ncbi:hypothetical protein ABPG74_002736 [Tetrahymena malaccensis]
MITVSKQSYLYLSQPYLKSEMASDSNIYECMGINEYFETFAYNSTLVQNITLQSHNYIHISFDVAFINFKSTLVNSIQYGQVDINGQTTTFSTTLTQNNYQCIPKGNIKNIDSKSQVSIILKHQGDLQLAFSAINFGSLARLGISNIVVDSILCGQNAQLDSDTLTCVCSKGSQETIGNSESNGIIYRKKFCL